MQHVQGGVLGATTKKALKDAVKNRPSAVNFFTTSNMGPQFNGSVEELTTEITLTVVGPDPYRKRDWYANIKRLPNGTLKVT